MDFAAVKKQRLTRHNWWQRDLCDFQLDFVRQATHDFYPLRLRESVKTTDAI
jgi:hypothetical protein